ncbi:MAG: response regulator [Hyphomicrobiaceae bacterium]|nr:response regulator [Hyphomicrobiaceae bacterium]MCC0009147.1 response regulator [Hyphomicrobiaceae bacterium]
MFEALKAANPANQLASLAMSDGTKTTDKIAADDPLAALRGGGSYATILIVLTLAAAMVLALLASPFGSPLYLTALATFAMLGVFFVLGMFAGHIRIGERLPEADLLKAIADGQDEGVLIVKRKGGQPVYANHAMAAFVGRSDSGDLGMLEAAFSSVNEAAEAMFRLNRAALAGEERAEILPAPSAAFDAEPRYVKVAVRPFISEAMHRDPGTLIIWTLTDVTEQRRVETEARASIDARLGLYDTMPVGLMHIDPDGMITHANATLIDWIGFAREAIEKRMVRLTDLVSADGAEVLMSAARRGDASLAIDLDILGEDGRSLPMHLVCRAAENDAPQANSDASDLDNPARCGLVIGCVNREAELLDATADSAAELRLSRFFQSAPFGIATVASNGTITNANPAFARMILDGTIGSGEQVLEILTPKADQATRQRVAASLADVLAGRGNIAPVEITVGQGNEFTRRVFMSPLAGAKGAREAAVLYVLDATEQKRLESRFAQSNKMEAVGTLAGGIAHDFNNVLTGIIGHSDFLLESHKPGDPAHRDLLTIKSSASRAAGLVSKLLAFSRQQTLQNEVLQLGEVVSEITPLMNKTVGEKISLKVLTERELWLVKTDRSQIDRVIVNLVVNAKDAMPDGGDLTIRTRNITERECQKMDHFGLLHGEYVAIEVSDTGTGMTPEVLNKIFEPFFTTKGVGKGTGLGLATVYGIVKQSGGFIYPESEVGKGTTFRVFLPRHVPDEEEVATLHQKQAKKSSRHGPDVTGSGRVLLVEDEDGVRSFAVRALRSRGFEVLEASNGAEALELIESNETPLDIVVSDVVMPEVDGPTLLKTLRKTHPDLKFVFMSGYPNDAFRAGLDAEEKFGFLPKPFSLAELVGKVKEELASE